MFRRLLCLLLACTLLPMGARAQFAADTSTFRATQLIAPSVLIGSGLAVHYFAHESIDAGVRELLRPDGFGGVPVYDIGTWIEYGSPVVYYGAGLLGAASRHAFVDRAIQGTVSYACAASVGFVAKRLFNTLRPDGSDLHSFPSGHTTMVFTSAELMRYEYGNLWGAGFYVLAAGTAAERVLSDRHWLSDVVAGAGLGILSAHVGRWLLNPVKSLFGIPDLSWDGLSTRSAQVAVLPSFDALSGTPTLGVSVGF